MNKKQQGFGLLEILVTLVVGSALFTGYAQMAGDAQRQTKDTVTAQHFKLISDASTRYIQDNWAAIQTAATPTVPAVVTTAMLTASGYLPTGFNGTNPYGQTVRTEILEPSAGNLQATVISMNGNTIPAGQAPRIASKVGAGGGYTPTATPTTAQGAFGGWSMPLTNITQPGAGHLIGLLYFNNGQLVTDYLRRHSVPGHPEVNQMFTNIDMNSQNVNNANQVNAQKVGLPDGNSLQIGSTYHYGDGANSAVRQPGGFYVQNQNGSTTYFVVDNAGDTHQGGWAHVNGAVNTQFLSDSNNAGYYVDPNGTSRTNYTIQDNNYVYGWTQADIFYDRSNTGYYMQPRGTTRLNYVESNDQKSWGNNAANTFQINGVATVGTGCSPNGLIAQNGLGEILNCVSGTWKKALGEKSITQTGTWGGQCTTILPPLGTSTATHNISYIWVHRAQCNWEQSHTLHDAGTMYSDAGVKACGTQYCPVGGSFMVVAISK